MKITPLAHQVIGKMALIGLLFAPFGLTPAYAAELVGKPVPAGAQAATVAASQASSEAQVAAKNAAVTNGATVSKAPVAPVVSTSPKEPIAPDEPESPEVSELCAPNSLMQNSDEIRQAIDELRDSIHHEMPSDFGDNPLGADVIIPVVAMLLLFGGPILLLIVLAVLHYRAKARRQQNINMNIDKLLAEGKDIPLEMLLGEEASVIKPPVRQGVVVASSRDDNIMQKGVRNIGLGTGWLIFLTIMFGINIGSFGFIFIGLGISQLVIWKLSGASGGTRPNAEEPETLKAQD